MTVQQSAESSLTSGAGGATAEGSRQAVRRTGRNAGNSGRGDLPYGGVDTPNSCIERNDGDFNACNVGNSARGDLPHRDPSR